MDNHPAINWANLQPPVSPLTVSAKSTGPGSCFTTFLLFHWAYHCIKSNWFHLTVSKDGFLSSTKIHDWKFWLRAINILTCHEAREPCHRGWEHGQLDVRLDKVYDEIFCVLMGAAGIVMQKTPRRYKWSGGWPTNRRRKGLTKRLEMTPQPAASILTWSSGYSSAISRLATPERPV